MAKIIKDLGAATAYGYAVDGGYTGTEEEFAALMASYAEVAEEAEESALKSEGNAVGEQDGVPVDSSSPYYHNNAKYYAEQAGDQADAAAAKAAEATQTVDGAISAITAAKNTAVEAVSAEGTTQVGNVNTAGATQVAAVEAKGEEVLESIPADYTELTDDVTQLKSATDNTTQYINLFDKNNPHVSGLFINVSGNKFQTDTDRLVTIPVLAGKKYAVKCGGNSTKRIAYSLDIPASNGACTVLMGDTAGTIDTTVDILANGYLSLQLFVNSDSDKTPSNYYSTIEIYTDDEITAVDKIARDLIIEENKIGLTCDDWTAASSILGTIYRNTGNELYQGTVSPATDVLKASGFIPLQGKMLELPMVWAVDTTYPNYGLSLYDKNMNPIYGRAVNAVPNRTDAYYVWLHVYIPDNAKYFRTTYWSDTSPAITQGYAPAFSYNLLAEIPDEYRPITHELPVDIYMQNSIRRARQLTDIKWTPRIKIPRYSMINGGSDHFLDWFYPDTEYIGIPYSGAGKGEGSSSGWTAPEEWGYAHKWVGGCVPFESFVTAARYPNSIFSETAEQAAPDYDSSPFGIVCTGLVNYAVDGPWPLRGITNFFDTTDRVFRKPAANNTISAIDKNEIMIGDFLYTKSHVIMITDIMRDANGNVTHVEMSEATTVGNGNNTILGSKYGGVARRKMWEYSEFKQLYGAYVKYRRTTFYGIPYIASKYVDTGNEGDRENIQDLPCIPYLGNGAIYRENYIHNSKVCIGATGFTSLVVTKDGEAFDTIDVTGLTEVSVGFSAVGNYEAYLTNGTTRTMACKWSVVSGTA